MATKKQNLPFIEAAEREGIFPKKNLRKLSLSFMRRISDASKVMVLALPTSRLMDSHDLCNYRHKMQGAFGF